MTPLLPALCAALAVALTLPIPARLAPVARPAPERRGDSRLMRHRLLVSGLAGTGAAVFVGGRGGLVAAGVVVVVSWVVIGRAEPPGVRRRREDVRRDLPHVVTLLGAALRGGAGPGEAIQLVCRALPGAATDKLEQVGARLALGADPSAVWSDLAHDPDLARLGRTMARTHTTGASVVGAIERLADDLAHRARSDVEDRARAVGVKAAVPLGLCLLPAFVLIGIVPLVAGLMSSLAW